MPDTTDVTRQIVNAYHRAWTHGGDFSDVPCADDIRVTGTLDTYNGTEEFRAMTARWAPAIEGIRIRQQLFDGEYAFSLYDLSIDMPIDDIRVAELINVKHGRIQAIDIVYDARKLVEVLGR